MPIEKLRADFRRLDSDELDRWSEVATSIIGDELNRLGIMDAGIRPLTPHEGIAGQAITVECAPGDNGPLHYALDQLSEGLALVANGQAYLNNALWGEIMHTCAAAQGTRLVVIDGSMRDLSQIRRSGLPAYARGVCPRGPHKGWGGSINKVIQCGGVPVSPGDLVVGDQDGIAIVPLDALPGLYERCRSRIEQERATLVRMREGDLTVSVQNLPPVEEIGR